MPKPRLGENRKDYMSRCVPEVRGEGYSADEAVGKCEGIYNYYKSKQRKTDKNR